MLKAHNVRICAEEISWMHNMGYKYCSTLMVDIQKKYP